jgi:hypothetical protein
MTVHGHGPLLRAVGVLSAVGILVTGVTFATLQSQQATLTGNSIQSASADLRVGTSAASFAASRSGFSFQGLVPGGPAAPADGYTFYLKNYGTATLNLKASIGSTPTNVVYVNGVASNADSVDLSKVSVELTRVDTNAVQTSTVQSLINGFPAAGLSLTDTIAPGAVVQYKLRAAMAGDAFSGSSASLGGIDLVFSGAADAN